MEIDALKLFKDGISSDDIEVKVDTVKKLSIVMKAIGESRVHDELVPFLTELTSKEDDEVLYVLAEQIENAWTHVSDKLTFLPILKILAKVDETIVREEAAKTMESIESSLSPKHVQGTFVPLVIELIGEEWFTGRLTSSLLIPAAYSKATSKQKEKLRKFFHQLWHDEMPMVRKAAAGKIGDFAKTVEKEVLEDEIIPNYAELTKDEHDNIKLAAVEKLHELVVLSPSSKTLLNIAKDAISDKSWKVRHAISKQVDSLIRGFGKKIASNHILDDLAKLLKDQEGEVRQEAVHSFTKCLNQLDKKKMEQYLLPTLKETYKDDYANYKEGIAQWLWEIASLLEDSEVTSSIMPILIELMKDQSSIVKITVLEGLVKMAKHLGVKIFDTTVQESFKALIKEAAWRVRMSVFELIGEIGIILGKQGFADTLEEIFLSFFSDKAAAIREKGIEKSVQLANAFGSDWVSEKLLPKAFENYHNEEQGYLYRMSSLIMFEKVIKFISESDIKNKFIPLLLKASEEKVPNIRFWCARAIFNIKAITKRVFDDEFNEIISRLKDDKDQDVFLKEKSTF